MSVSAAPWVSQLRVMVESWEFQRKRDMTRWDTASQWHALNICGRFPFTRT